VGKLENPIELEAVARLKKIGWIVIKLEVTHWPDRMAISPSGVVVFIEFKRPDGPVRPGQQTMIGELKRRGVHASLQHNAADAVYWATTRIQ